MLRDVWRCVKGLAACGEACGPSASAADAAAAWPLTWDGARGLLSGTKDMLHGTALMDVAAGG